MKYSLRRFFKNLRYLARFDLKEINNRPEVSSFTFGMAERLQYAIKNDFETICPPLVKNNFETLQEILTTDKSLIRFGDGEYIIMEGRGIPFQKYDKKLSLTLKEIILESHDNLLVGINYEYFHTATRCHKSVRKFIHTYVSSHYDSILKYIDFSRQYVSAAVFQPYVYYKYYDFDTHYRLVTNFFHNKSITLVCGDKILKDIQYFIFEQAKEITYIYGPTKHAYVDFERLKSLIQKRPKDEILVFALGPAGKALAYEGFKMGYRVLDIGHAIKDYDYYKKQIKLDEQSIRDFSKPDE